MSTSSIRNGALVPRKGANHAGSDFELAHSVASLAPGRKEFELPRIVKARVDADVQQASALALSTALFAGSLVSLAQLVATHDGDFSRAWNALRFFTYGSIAINLSSTILSLIIIKMGTDIYCLAQRRAISHELSLPARFWQGEPLSDHHLLKHHELLVEFGMPRGYRILDIGASIWVVLGSLFTFISLVLWLWLSEQKVIAGTTLIAVVPAILAQAYAISVTRV